MAATKDKRTSRRVFSSLVNALKALRYSVTEIATDCGLAEQTVRQYLANPDTTAFRTPTLDAIDALVDELARVENIAVSGVKYRVVFADNALPSLGFKSAVGAQDFIDQMALKLIKADIEVIGGGELPELTMDEMLRMHWRWAVKGKILTRHVLAEIAGISVYEVGLVGREISLRIQPTQEQVDAIAAARRSALTKTLLKELAA